MVYNALKLFMELNADIFEETMQHYKQQKIECVAFVYLMPML
jgi:serine/threonine-protein phosphatase 2A regulatory subunit B'